MVTRKSLHEFSIFRKHRMHFIVLFLDKNIFSLFLRLFPALPGYSKSLSQNSIDLHLCTSLGNERFQSKISFSMKNLKSLLKNNKCALERLSRLLEQRGTEVDEWVKRSDGKLSLIKWRISIFFMRWKCKFVCWSNLQKNRCKSYEILMHFQTVLMESTFKSSSPSYEFNEKKSYQYCWCLTEENKFT